jgi:hypothetical protein
MVAPTIFEDEMELEKDVMENFHQCLLKLNITSTLFLIDPYFFASTKKENNYDKVKKAEFFIKLIMPCLEGLSKLVIVSLGNNLDQHFKDLFIEEVERVNSKIEIVCLESNSFHDRFAYNPLLLSGIGLGASFNGLLKKINRFDNIPYEEAVVLEKLLKAEGLL